MNLLKGPGARFNFLYGCSLEFRLSISFTSVSVIVSQFFFSYSQQTQSTEWRSRHYLQERRTYCVESSVFAVVDSIWQISQKTANRLLYLQTVEERYDRFCSEQSQYTKRSFRAELSFYTCLLATRGSPTALSIWLQFLFSWLGFNQKRPAMQPWTKYPISIGAIKCFIFNKWTINARKKLQKQPLFS